MADVKALQGLQLQGRRMYVDQTGVVGDVDSPGEGELLQAALLQPSQQRAVTDLQETRPSPQEI